jgi:hypothetical protein
MEQHMKLKLNPFTSITLLDPDFVQAINTILECSPINTSDGAILTFNPDNQPGGHNNLSPLELAVNPDGSMQYFIVYSKSVSSHIVESSWNFSDDTFTQFGEISDIAIARCSLQLITRNLSGQLKASLYQTDTAPLLDLPQTVQSR